MGRKESGTIYAECGAQQLCIFGHRWVVRFQSGGVLGIEILQAQWLDRQWLDRQDLALDTRKIRMAFKDEGCRSHEHRVIPADRRGLFARHHGVVVPLVEPDNASSVGFRVKV